MNQIIVNIRGIQFLLLLFIGEKALQLDIIYL